MNKSPKSPFENQFNKAKRDTFLRIFNTIVGSLDDVWKFIDKKEIRKQIVEVAQELTDYLLKKYPPENGVEEENKEKEAHPPY